tara:strand:- start:8097 stop:11024 length:2928 start_codon:yes stop_codon:yes gene_type:complete
MGQSFTGTPFDQGVKTQIETRQKSLGKFTNIPSKDLQYYNTKTPFLRLASSVDLEFYNPLKGVPKQLKNLGYPVDTWDGYYLAKNIILQGGVMSADFNEGSNPGKLKFGLNDGNSVFNGAYGWGGTSERGYVPMPGITTADVTYYNNGALAKCNINIKCFSKAQFQLIDILYLRPGYTLLMEFGHSVWLDKDGNLQSMDSFLTEPMSKFLSPDEGTNQYEIYQSIKTARETYDYNYEAFFGQISNFNWQFNSDGSYDCQVQLTSLGDVISALKCNITDPSLIEIKTDTRGWWKKLWTSDPDPTQQPPLVANANKTIVNRELYGIYQAAQVSDPQLQLLDYELVDYKGVDESGKPETPSSLIFSKGLLTIPGTTADIEENQSPQVYIKYGAFLAYLQSKILLYDNSTDTPLVVFDVDFKNLDEDENVIFKVPGQFSADPRICIIPYSNTNIGEGVSLPQTKINEVVSATAWEYQTYLGRVGNIMVNINFLATCLVDASDEKGNINVIDYLKSINNGLITALGDINEFKIKLSDDGLKLIFNENIPQRRTPDTPTSEYTRFNVYGVKPGIEGSFIRNVTLNASIPSNFATMISIGAQNNGNQLSENATSFSNYNMGLVDRIIKVKESIYPKKTPTNEDTVDEVTIKTNFDDNINATNEEGASLFLKIYGDTSLKFLNDNIGSLVSHNKTHASLLVGKLTKDNQIQAPFFLPFNFQLEMDGLSGMKLYQKFLMTDDILPPTYTNDGVDLQITGINHKIDTSSWITELTTQSVAAETLGAPARPKQLVSSQTTQQSSAQGDALPLSTNEAPASDDPESVERFNAMQSSYNYVFSRDGEISGMCARYSYNLALNYMRYLRSNAPEKRQLAAGGNANNNQEYYNNLTALGYTKTQSVVTKTQLLNDLATRTWGYGDVVAYYCNNGPTQESHVKYGHTQVYVGTINSVGWTTSTRTNYNTDFPYRSRVGDNWTYLIFTAPAE